MKHTADSISKVLSGIQARIPKNLTENVVREELASPTMAFVVDKALKSKKVPEEKKRQLQILKDAGEFSKTRFVENKKIVKIIDEFVAREINKEIRKGNLPPRSEIPNLPHIKEFYEKVRNQGGQK